MDKNEAVCRAEKSWYLVPLPSLAKLYGEGEQFGVCQNLDIFVLFLISLRIMQMTTRVGDAPTNSSRNIFFSSKIAESARLRSIFSFIS